MIWDWLYYSNKYSTCDWLIQLYEIKYMTLGFTRWGRDNRLTRSARSSGQYSVKQKYTSTSLRQQIHFNSAFVSALLIYQAFNEFWLLQSRTGNPGPDGREGVKGEKVRSQCSFLCLNPSLLSEIKVLPPYLCPCCQILEMSLRIQISPSSYLQFHSEFELGCWCIFRGIKVKMEHLENRVTLDEG